MHYSHQRMQGSNFLVGSASTRNRRPVKEARARRATILHDPSTHLSRFGAHR